MADINLVPQEVKLEQRKQSVVKKTTVLTILIAVVVSVISAFMFMRAAALESKIDKTQKEVDSLRTEIVGLANVEVIARNLDLKYKALSEIFQTRPYHSFLLDEFIKRVPSSIAVDTFSFGKENTINISGQGDNYLAIAEFINNLSNKDFQGGNENLKGLFTGVTLNSVSLDAQTGVEASFFVVLNFDQALLKQ